MNFKTTIQVTKTELNFSWKKMHKIYFIETGIVDIYKNNELWFSLNEGSYFGIESLIKFDENQKNIIYKVSDECPYAIFYTIDIPFLINEILNYDEESFIGIIYLANYYIKNVLNKGDNLDENNINNNFNLIDNKNIINTNISNENNEENKIDILDKGNNKNEIEKGLKINLDLINPGCLPELNKKIEEYEKAEKIVDESNLKIDLMEKQMNFINKYMNKIKANKDM